MYFSLSSVATLITKIFLLTDPFVTFARALLSESLLLISLSLSFRDPMLPGASWHRDSTASAELSPLTRPLACRPTT